MVRARFRHEDKYIIDPLQAQILKERARAIMRRDPYAGSDGFYSIKSLYFDDASHSCYHETENGTDPRAKFRIRAYNNDLGMLRLEKKMKARGLTAKESALISLRECEELIKGRIPEPCGGEDEKKRSLFTELGAKRLKPVIIIAYDRMPFILDAFNIRFTIDMRLSCSLETDSFLSKDLRLRVPVRAEQGRFLVQTAGREGALSLQNSGYSVMELKWDDILPPHLKEYLSLESLRMSRFSKYYSCMNAMLS